MSIDSFDIQPKELNFSWIPEKSTNIDNLYCIDFSQSYIPKKRPLIIEKEISDEDNIICIYFISGMQLRIAINKDIELIHLKKWLLDCFLIYSSENSNEYKDRDYYDYYFMIDFIDENKEKINCLEIYIKDIDNNKLDCVFSIKEQNIFICLKCTSECHELYNTSQSWNTNCAGNTCYYGCGLLCPDGLDIHNIPKNIPTEYEYDFYDIDWFNFKIKIKYYLDLYEYFKQLSKNDIIKIKSLESIYSRKLLNTDYYDYEDEEFYKLSNIDKKLINEYRNLMFIKSCFNDRFL